MAEERDSASQEESCAALVRRQSRLVFRVAYAVLRNAHDAEDVVQETFLKLYRSGRWRGIENEKAFLARTAWRIAIDRRPKHREEQPGDGIAAGGADPESAAVSADWNAAVLRLVDALPEDLRRPLVLSAIESWTSREIAGVIGVPEGTVRTRLMRARQVLREKLETLRARHHG